jgi:hypothetical protein
MPQLWLHDTNDWVVLPLDGDSLALANLPGAGDGTDAILLKGAGEARAEWHLLAAPEAGLALNGLPLQSGLRTLTDRDEIRIPGLGAVYFSTERLARSEPFPALPHPVSCPRCRQAIAAGTPAVRCPGCEVWHHASPELPCWSYAERCALCPQPTAAEAGYRWTPEAL